MVERLYTVKELAEILGVPASWIYERTRPGSLDRIPHIRMRKYIRFTEDMVREFIESRKVKGQSGQPLD